MLKEFVQSGNLYGYNVNFYSGGKGIVMADSKEDAGEKVRQAYQDQGILADELSEVEVWKVTTEKFHHPGVLEIWE